MVSRSTAASAVPPSLGSDLAAWRAAIRSLPDEMRSALAPMFDPTALGAARRRERDDLLLTLIAGAAGASANARAGVVHRILQGYASTAWRYDRDREAPHRARNAAAHRVLKLCGGKAPSARTIRRTLTGLGQNTPRTGQSGAR